MFHRKRFRLAAVFTAVLLLTIASPSVAAAHASQPLSDDVRQVVPPPPPVPGQDTGGNGGTPPPGQDPPPISNHLQVGRLLEALTRPRPKTGLSSR